MRLVTPKNQDFNVAYLSRDDFSALDNVVREGAYEHIVGAYTKNGGMLGDLKLPPRTIIMTECPLKGTKAERIIFGGILVHEIEHTRGGNEWDAHVAEREYLQKNGLKGATDTQIFAKLFISERYDLSEALYAEKMAYGNVKSRWRSVAVSYTHLTLPTICSV